MDSAIAQKLKDLEQRISTLEAKLASTGANSASRGSSKRLSAKEFLQTKHVRSLTEKTLVLAYYCEHVIGLGLFNVDDLETAFRQAKEPLPANVNDVVNKNIAKGFIMEETTKKDSKKVWVLTSTGENRVTNILSKEGE